MSELREAEEVIRGAAPSLSRWRRRDQSGYYSDRRCRWCGEVKELHCRAKVCEDCRHERDMKKQRERRAVKAGLLVTVPHKAFRLLQSAARTCGHCGGEFKPKRTTARYCSTKCRVYAARARSNPPAGEGNGEGREQRRPRPR